MEISVKNYTNRFVIVVILIVMAVWALLFYALLMDEVYDNIDDGLKNQKIEIIREAYNNPEIIHKSTSFGINQFVIKPISSANENLDNNNFSREFIYMPYDAEDEPYRVLRTGFFTKDGKAYSLEIRTSTVEEDDFLINLAISLTVLYTVVVLSIMMINHFVFSKAWKPFKNILDNLNNYQFGKVKSFEIVDSEIKEFNLLNSNIQKMIERNESIFDQQKQFLENASHELQTPIAVSINKLSLLLEDSTLSEEQVRKIVEAKNSLHRMVNLNKSLLTLSRIDNKQYTSIELVSMDELLKSLVNDLQDILDFKNISVDFVQKSTFETSINSSLAQILLSNLLNNAIKYNFEFGKINISINSDSIIISNTSSSGALNPDYIFRRFYKGAQDNNSNGLGLSIVNSILVNYPQLHLSYYYKEHQHFFEIKQ